MIKPKAFIFDAYGTLFDVHSVIDALRSVASEPQALSTLWRQKQVEYTWLRALMGRYEDFWTVTENALRFSLNQLRIPAEEETIRRLMDSYLSLSVFPEVQRALDKMADTPMAILSNGSPSMLAAMIRHNGLEGRFVHVLSVDTVRTYKPSPAVYALGTQAFSLAAEEILFVSSNGWDVAGAKAFGYRTCWCNRSGACMEKLGITSDLEVIAIDQIY